MKQEIRKLLGTEKLIIGSERVLKALRNGGVARVIIASNVPEEFKLQLNAYQQAAGFELQQLEVTNDELGTICKKPFSIAALAILA